MIAMLLCSVGWATEIGLASERLAMVRAIQSATHEGTPVVAESLATRYVRAWPGDPTGYYARAVARRAASLGCEAPDDIPALLDDLDAAIRLGSGRIETRNASIWDEYVLGLSLGFRAVMNLEASRPWSAWRDSRRSVAALEGVLRADSTYADALLPLGTYHFWRGQALASWSWLPFVDDSRDQGIAELRAAAEKGATTAESALNMLMWALLAYGSPAEALSTADTLLAKFPDNVSALWARAEALKALSRWDDAERAFARGAEAFGSNLGCHGVAELRAKRGVMLVELARCDEARPILHQALGYEPPESAADEYEAVRGEVLRALATCGRLVDRVGLERE